MFVSKIISGIPARMSFKSQQHKINEYGQQVELFGYPYDPETEIGKIVFVRAKLDDRYNVILDESSAVEIDLKPEGIEADPREILDIYDGEPYAYKIKILDKENPDIVKWEGADTGIKIKNTEGNVWGYRTQDNKHWVDVKDENKQNLYSYETLKYADLYNDKGEFNDPYKYSLMPNNGTAPMLNGAGILVMPDSLYPGAKFRGFDDQDTGEIYFDKAAQNKAEKSLRNFSNIMGGNIAGLIEYIPYMNRNGYTMLFSTPVANGDDVSSHSYWNKNNMQIASRMGNTENFAKFMREMYKNQKLYVYDGTFTSEGLEGIHFQYALRWANKNPQSYYWFRMQGLKNTNLGLGVIPEHAKNLSHRVINSKFNPEKQADGTYKLVENRKYDSSKPTIFQIYDASQVSDNLKALDKQIRVYDNLTSKKPMAINTHDDTLIAYAFQINPNEYTDRIKVINKLIKSGEEIDLYGEHGTILAGQFSNFKIDSKTEGGFVTWDANTDMVKMNYGISGYDLKNLKAITDRAQRAEEQARIIRGATEVQDMTLQAGRYWTSVVNDIQNLYTAKTIGTAIDVRKIDGLIAENKLPERTHVTQEVIENIINGEYVLNPKGVLDKDSVTVKALMKLPLDAVEFGENTVGVLSTSYFSNRATTEETLGKTRFELLMENNPHLIDEYAGVYNKVNSMYVNELKDFAHRVIEKVNEESNEKLLSSDGKYTEYGEYVIELVGKDIAKYALLKSLSGDKFRVKIIKDGDLTYDYDSIKENTTLQALGITANSPEEEAESLLRKIKKGLNTLGDKDVDIISESISNRISGTNTNSFRIAEALVRQAACGLAWRLDAAKDIKDQDAVRNREDDFQDTWDSMAKFWEKFVQKVKAENPSSYIVAEITDVPELMKATYGPNSSPYDGNTNVNNPKFNGDNEAQTKFFIKTGITSEAGYSYLFTNLLHNFAGNFENGDYSGGINHDDFKRRIDYLMQTRTPDYSRNLYTFIGNHDKTRTVQGLSVDMKLFQSPLTLDLSDEKINYDSENQQQLREQREKVIQVLSGVTSLKDAPMELRLNIDNMDYFRTISPKAVAQAKALMLPVMEDISDIATPQDIKAITEAIIDLANGNYLIDRTSKPMTRIDVSEISTLEGSVREIIKLAKNHGFAPENADLTAASIIKAAKDIQDWKDYYVRGDFTVQNDEELTHKNRMHLKEITGKYDEGNDYSLYTVQAARLIKEAARRAGYQDNAINEALKDFVNKYNRQFVEAHTKEPVKTETVEITRNKDSFGVKPFENVMDWVINQAEYKTGDKIKNREEIIDRVVTSLIEPAIRKQSMMMAFLSGLIGDPTIFAGDEYGLSGYEDKAKNRYLNPRNTVHEPVKKSTFYAEVTHSSIKDRSNAELHALNYGTPYEMDILVNGRNRDEVKKRIKELSESVDHGNLSPANEACAKEEIHKLTKELAKISYMMYTPDGDAVVTVLSAHDINHSNRFDYYDYIAKEYGIDTEDARREAFENGTLISPFYEKGQPYNKYVPIQHSTEMDAILLGAGVSLPVGTIFLNAENKNLRYVVQQIKDKGLGIVKEGGGKIVMDAKTAIHGVLRLVRENAYKVPFRGKNLNQQYNIMPSAVYKTPEAPEEGKNLSLIAG